MIFIKYAIFILIYSYFTLIIVFLLSLPNQALKNIKLKQDGSSVKNCIDIDMNEYNIVF